MYYRDKADTAIAVVCKLILLHIMIHVDQVMEWSMRHALIKDLENAPLNVVGQYSSNNKLIIDTSHETAFSISTYTAGICQMCQYLRVLLRNWSTKQGGSP